jgi:dihydropteroate synthase
LLLPNRKLKIDKPLIMGILNVTPDSFSDGGNYFQPDQAYRRAVEMLEAEVDIIDIGAESTRPGAVGISVQEEWGRLEPIIKKIRKKIDLPLSIDTYKSEIALQALNEGVDMVNDISGLTFDQHMTEVVAKFRSPIILMHIKGTPRNMQTNPHYENILEEIYFFLAKQVSYSLNNGIKQIIIDPGIGFGKRLKDNFEIIRRLPEFKGLGLPILVGPSRKSFIGNTLNLPPNDRLTGTIAAVTACILQGANIVRVHDVEEIKQVVIIARSIMTQKA